MATVNIILENVCSGGQHANLGVTVNGGEKRIVPLIVDELRSSMSTEEIDATLKGLLKLHSIGKTAAQFKASVLAGFQVTV